MLNIAVKRTSMSTFAAAESVSSMFECHLTSCAGKEAFSDVSVAKKVMKNVARRHIKTKFKTYKCQHCGSWHIGATTGDIKPTVKRKKLHFIDE